MTLLGASGLVGGHVVGALLEDPGVARLTLPGRRPPSPAPSDPRVSAPVVDFEALERHGDAFRCDQLLVCLGTTRRRAGSAEAFRRVDHDYVLAAAELAVREGARGAVLVSSVGADPDSRFLYTRVKGEVEDALAALPFRSVAVLRPSVLLGERGEHRTGESVAGALGRLLSPVMVGPLARWRPVEAATVARAMARLAARPRPGLRVVESEAIPGVAAGSGGPTG